jgi:hypothetical protein
VRAILWPVLGWSARAHQPLLVACTIGEGANPAFDRSVGVGSASHCNGGSTGESAALASVLSVGVGSSSHIVGGHDR